MGAAAQRARLIDPRNRPATGADRLDVDAGKADRGAVFHIPVAGDGRLAVEHDRDIATGAAHIEPDGVVEATEISDVAARERPGGDAGPGEAPRVLLGALRGHHTAPAVEQQEVAPVALCAQGVVEAEGVLAHHRAERRVHDGRREALVLEDFGQDLGGGRHRHTGEFLHQDLLHAPLVLAVRVGVDEAHRHRFHLALAQHTRHLAGLSLIEGLCHVSEGIDLLGHHQTIAPADVGRGVVLVGIPQVLFGGAPDLDDIPEPLGGHHRRPRETTRDQRVGRHGGAVGEERHIVEVDPDLLEGAERAFDGILRGARHLADPDLPGALVEHTEVGEGSADVDGDAEMSHGALPRPAGRPGGVVPAGGTTRAYKRPHGAIIAVPNPAEGP